MLTPGKELAPCKSWRHVLSLGYSETECPNLAQVHWSALKWCVVSFARATRVRELPQVRATWSAPLARVEQSASHLLEQSTVLHYRSTSEAKYFRFAHTRWMLLCSSISGCSYWNERRRVFRYGTCEASAHFGSNEAIFPHMAKIKWIQWD